MDDTTTEPDDPSVDGPTQPGVSMDLSRFSAIEFTYGSDQNPDLAVNGDYRPDNWRRFNDLR